MAYNPICRTVFDSRDLSAYIAELTEDTLAYFNDEFDQEFCDYEELKEELDNNPATYEEYKEDSWYKDFEELTELIEFQEELMEYSSEYKYGETIIHEDYLEEYFRDLVDDLGYLPKSLPSFITSNIDWDGVALDLLEDYSVAHYDCNKYFIRSI